MTLDIISLSQSYGEKNVLRDITMSVEQGETISVIGPNGSGKSTLIRTICGSLKKEAGQVIVDGVDADSMERKEFAKKVGYVPQKFVPQDHMMVFDMLMIGRSPHSGWSYSETDFKVAGEAASMLGIEDLLDRSLDQLSGGQIQKTVIGRALSQQPDYYLLDEPTSALDLMNQISVLKTMKNISKKTGAGVLIALHDLNLAMRYSDKVILLKDGTVFASGEPDEAITPENIMSVYGVDAEIVEGRGGKYVHICDCF